jgi:hypothetical protein
MQKMFGDSFKQIDKEEFTNNLKQIYVISVASMLQDSPDLMYTRVVKGAFYLMNMIMPYKKYSFYKEFTTKFSESLFMANRNDKANIIETKEKQNKKIAHLRTLSTLCPF